LYATKEILKVNNGDNKVSLELPELPGRYIYLFYRSVIAGPKPPEHIINTNPN